MKKLSALLMVFAVAVLSGCAHQIQLNPDLTNLPVNEAKSDKAVGYVLTDELRNKKVTTPGGGGDKVTYTPYKDTETALYTLLSNKFEHVYLMESADDKAFIAENNIAYIFTPSMTTNSSSSSFVTWPPTSFTVELTCKAVDAQGNAYWENTVSTEGNAEFDEFVADFSLSARRATKQAFEQMAHAINTAEEFE